MSNQPHTLVEVAKIVVKAAVASKKLLVTAESCTGGMIASALTQVAGSSTTFQAGFITYSNEAKCQLLGVPADTINEFGAVSAPVSAAMAEGALAVTSADIAISVTGIAGPTGGTEKKPVGLVFLALAENSMDTRVKRKILTGNRDEIRHAAVATALNILKYRLEKG